MLILKPNVRHSTFALLMELVVLLNTASFVPMEPFSTRTTSSATGGSMLTVLNLLLSLRPRILKLPLQEMLLLRLLPLPLMLKPLMLLHPMLLPHMMLPHMMFPHMMLLLRLPLMLLEVISLQRRQNMNMTIKLLMVALQLPIKEDFRNVP